MKQSTFGATTVKKLHLNLQPLREFITIKLRGNSKI